MNIFRCQSCGERLYFENNHCLSCGHTLGFLPDVGVLSALHPVEEGIWQPLEPSVHNRLYRKCRNYEHDFLCNWMVPHGDDSEFCLSCSLSRSIPDLSRGNHRELWAKLETAKRRLVYTLLKLKLPVVPKWKDPERGLAFDFLADPTPEFPEGERILTGHNRGVITINVAEADDAVREKMRLNLREVYRTLLGHFRHESGHYFWDLLVRDHPRIDLVRGVFGDERTDYAESLRRHYQLGTLENWQDYCVTPYAASHPWEDWAETWAHYLHIMDTVETAASYRMEIDSPEERQRMGNPFNSSFEKIIEDWLSLRFVLNGLNRSMGFADPYPFILSQTVINKLAFIHNWIKQYAHTIQMNSRVA